MADQGLKSGAALSLPDDRGQLLAVLIDEFRRISARLDEIEGSFFTLSYSAPPKPREGMIRFADGTSWNPGSGKGLYQYKGGAWTPLF